MVACAVAETVGGGVTELTFLHRQIHPMWRQDGRVTSQAFRPTPKDERKLSVYDGDLIAAADAWRHFTSQLKLASVGVLAVTVRECSSVELRVSPDPEPFPEHAVIDFSGYSENAIQKKAKILRHDAESRGWLHQAD